MVSAPVSTSQALKRTPRDEQGEEDIARSVSRGECSPISHSHISSTSTNTRGNYKAWHYDTARGMSITDEEVEIMERWGSFAQGKRMEKAPANGR